MSSTFKMSFSILFAAVLIIGLSACQSNETTQKTEKIRVAEVTRSVFYAPQYVALAKGFFKKEGLDVQLKTTWGGDKTMTALLSGGTDIGLVGSETSIYVYTRGSKNPVINFAQLTQTDGTFLISRKKMDHFTWSQLKDSRFLGQRKGGMPQMVGEYVLKKNGIDPHKDLHLIQNIDYANIPNAFASGIGDFVQLFEPQASIFEKEGKGYIVASFGKESGHVPYTSYMATKSYMESHQSAVSKFTRAIYQAQQWVADHNSKEIAQVIHPYFKDTDTDMLAKAIDRYKNQGTYATDPILDPKEWNHLQSIMKEAGELPKQVDYKTLVNTSFAEKAIKD